MYDSQMEWLINNTKKQINVYSSTSVYLNLKIPFNSTRSLLNERKLIKISVKKLLKANFS